MPAQSQHLGLTYGLTAYIIWGYFRSIFIGLIKSVLLKYSRTALFGVLYLLAF